MRMVEAQGMRGEEMDSILAAYAATLLRLTNGLPFFAAR